MHAKTGCDLSLIAADRRNSTQFVSRSRISAVFSNRDTSGIPSLPPNHIFWCDLPRKNHFGGMYPLRFVARFQFLPVFSDRDTKSPATRYRNRFSGVCGNVAGKVWKRSRAFGSTPEAFCSRFEWRMSYGGLQRGGNASLPLLRIGERA